MKLLAIKILLVALNILITILGTVLLTIGYVLQFRTEMFTGYLAPLLKVIPAGGGTGADVWTLYNYTSIFFIAGGSIIVLIGVTGCVIGTCPSKFHASVYLATLGMILLSQITGTAILASTDIDGALMATLINNLRTKYTSEVSMDEYSQAWNYIFVEFDCCAVESYTEFELTVRWDSKQNISGIVTTVIIPETCCKLPGEYPDHSPPYHSNCTIAPTQDNSNYLKGCYEPLRNHLWYNYVLMIVCESSPVPFEIFALVLGVMVASGLRKHDKISLED